MRTRGGPVSPDYIDMVYGTPVQPYEADGVSIELLRSSATGSLQLRRTLPNVTSCTWSTRNACTVHVQTRLTSVDGTAQLSFVGLDLHGCV